MASITTRSGPWREAATRWAKASPSEPGDVTAGVDSHVRIAGHAQVATKSQSGIYILGRVVGIEV